MFHRKICNIMGENAFKGKVFILVGTRQTGKTTAVNLLIQTYYPNKKTIQFNCDNPTDREALTDKNFVYLDALVGDAEIIFIDEAQKVSTIGQTLKLWVDAYGSTKQIIATGSSSFNLLSNTQEPLTGRKRVYQLYPMSLEEVYTDKDRMTLLRELEITLLYGLYPEVVSASSLKEKRDILVELASSYLYKDIFEFQQLKNPDVLYRLLKAIALQTGSPVSYNELSNMLGIDKNTVERYVDLLEKSFILYRLSPYYTNKRKELSKSRKIYFYDVGIRNALVNNFNPIDSRDDVGALWENFIISERLKYRSLNGLDHEQYFWKGYQGGEVDLVEIAKGTEVHGYEIKWGKSKPKPPKAWTDMNANYAIINKETFMSFVIG